MIKATSTTSTFWTELSSAAWRVDELRGSLARAVDVAEVTEHLIERIKSEDLSKSFFASILVTEDVLFNHLDHCINEALRDDVLTDAELSDILAACSQIYDVMRNGAELESLLRVTLLNTRKPLKTFVLAEEFKACLEHIAAENGLKALLVEQRRAIKIFSEVKGAFSALNDALGNSKNKKLYAFLSSDDFSRNHWADGSLLPNFFQLKNVAESCTFMSGALSGLEDRGIDFSDRVYERFYSLLDGQHAKSFHDAIELSISLLETAKQLIEVELQSEKQLKDDVLRIKREADAQEKRLKEASERNAHIGCVTARALMYVVLAGGYARGAYFSYELLFWTGLWNTLFATVFWAGSAFLLLFVWAYLDSDGENPSSGNYSKGLSLFQSFGILFLAVIYYSLWDVYAFS
jgi:hypothetical protein